MKNKTAVDWLIEKLTSKPISDLTDEEWFGIMGEAKELERQQIELSWKAGDTNGRISIFKKANEYYNLTYGGNNEQ